MITLRGDRETRSYSQKKDALVSLIFSVNFFVMKNIKTVTTASAEAMAWPPSRRNNSYKCNDEPSGPVTSPQDSDCDADT